MLIFLFIIILSFASYFLESKLTNDNKIILVLTSTFLFPILLFLNEKINFGGLTIINSSFVDIMLSFGVFLILGGYWTFNLIKNKKSELVFDPKLFYLLSIILVNNFQFKLFVCLFVICTKFIKVDEKSISFRTIIFPCIGTLLWATNNSSINIEIVYFIFAALIFILMFSKTTLLEHFLFFQMLGLTFHENSSSNYYIYTMVVFLVVITCKFILTNNDSEKINKYLSKYEWLTKLNFYINKSFQHKIGFGFVNFEDIQNPSKLRIRNNLQFNTVQVQLLMSFSFLAILFILSLRFVG